MKRRKSLTGETSGQALLEFALILPLLALLLLGIVDFSRGIYINNVISNMSREGANLSSRTTLAAQDIMNALALTAQPLTMQSNGMIYVTVVQGTSGSLPTIQSQAGWQQSSLVNTIRSRIGTPSPTNPNPIARNLGTLTLAAGQTASIVEVFYNYEGFFSNVIGLPNQFYSITIF